MKKLLSICFLSMLLGLLSFGVRAQNDNGCKSGFWIENLQPDTAYGIVNSPDGTGKVTLVHTLGSSVFSPTTGAYLGDAHVGNTELYELHFCNTCGLDPKTKVSIDWVLLRREKTADGFTEWVEVNDNLSDYAEFSIYTFYNNLNQYGECQSIAWLGGRVTDGFGYCNELPTPTLYDTIVNGVYPCAHVPTNYPGALQTTYGTPYSVMTQLGEIVPSAGLVNIYSQNHDYFYLDFFEQTRNIVVLKWLQAGDYKLVMRVRQRWGGTAWTNEHWKLNPDGTLSEMDYVGGHQSCCGPVLAIDTIYQPYHGEDSKEVCQGETYTYGRPPYTFTTTMADTNVVFGEIMFDGSDCMFFHTDSINKFHFFVREKPVVQTHDTTICKCDGFGQNDLNSLVTVDNTAAGLVSVRLEWSLNGTTGWSVNIPNPAITVGTHHYYVRAVNVYETIECIGEPAQITLIIKDIPAPQIVGGPYDFCNESDDSTQVLTANRGNDDCSTTSIWYLNGVAIDTGDVITVHLADIRPTTNVDKTVTFTVKAYNENNNCVSVAYSSVQIRFHQTPEFTLSYDTIICPHADAVTLRMDITSLQTEHPYQVNQTSDFANPFNETLNSPITYQNKTYARPYDKIQDFLCGETYHVYYKVTDQNNCVAYDTATFTAMDTTPPSVNPSTWEGNLYQCNFETRPDTIKDIALFATLFNVEIWDEGCEKIDTMTVKDTVYVNPLDSCEMILVRTYTFYDYCENSSTFTQTYTTRDTTKPHFVVTPGRPLYERLTPNRGMNCTYNSLSKAQFVTALLGKVEDNCVTYDYEYLFNHSDFYWEKSSRFGHVLAYDSLDIFRDMVGNQLTVEVVVWDDCGNVLRGFVFWFDKPEELKILHPSITVDPANICLGDTSALTFDPTKVTFDPHFTLAEPLQYQWSCADTNVNFIGETNDVTISASPTVGDTNYVIYMTVTDAYGCTAFDSANLYVKNPPVIVIVPTPANNIGEMPYCPNVGSVMLAARDANDPTQVVPNLSYNWSSSESVDVHFNSHKDTTRLWIVPELCTHIYDAQVHVIDTIFGCVADASILVPVKDTTPVYIGGPHHDTASLAAHCTMLVTDFTHYVVDSLYNPCGIWPPDTIWQVPAVGTPMTVETPVTVYVVSHCADDTLKIQDKFSNLPYPYNLKVTASVEPTEGCDPTTFYFDATTEYAHGTVNFTWTKGAAVVSNNHSFSNTDTVADGSSTSIYKYIVLAVDSLECKSTDSVTVTVFSTFDEPDVEIYKNKRCVPPYDGMITLIEVPKIYTYRLSKLIDAIYHETAAIATQIPAFDGAVDLVHVVFAELEAGEYKVTVITPDSCVSNFYYTVEDSIVMPKFEGEINTVIPTYCTNDNGEIHILNNLDYNYYVKQVNEEGDTTEFTSILVNDSLIYPNLATGDYIVYKEDKATLCIIDTTVNIGPSQNTLEFPVDADANTLCGDSLFNGKIYLTQTGIHYIVTNSKGDTIYTGANTTIDSLPEDVYLVYGKDLTTGCENTIPDTVPNGRANPKFTATPNPNTFCENDYELFNGSVTLVGQGNYIYNYYQQFVTLGLIPPISIDEEGNVIGGEIVEPTVEYNYVPVAEADKDSLAAGWYKIEAIDANGCVADTIIEIVDNNVTPNVTVNTTPNSICDSTITAYTGMVKITISNYTAARTYTVILGEDTVKPATKVTTFNNLKEGVYNYKVIDDLFCYDEGEVQVDTVAREKLILKMTPNTYCEGTYNKPGNGTITVMPPYHNVSNYNYTYFFAPEGEEEIGPDLEVHYVSLTNTFYWLIDTIYYVKVTDLSTGCVVGDTITVPQVYDTLQLTGNPTPDTNCIAPFNGSIELTASFIPAQFEHSHMADGMYEIVYPNEHYYLYSIDNGLTFHDQTIFEGLNQGDYDIAVYDTVTRCIYQDGVVFVDKVPSDIVINDSIVPNGSCDSALYDGKLFVEATSEYFSNADYVFYLVHDGDTLATNSGNPTSWDSLAPGFYTVIAHDLISGCEADSTYEIPTVNICVPEIEVDSRKYCLNEENATLTAFATLPEGCGDSIVYRWHKECYNEYSEGPTVNVPTDQEMCCFYTVTATSVSTGCSSEKRVKVCVYATEPIIYTVHYEPIEGNYYEICENDTLTIGIVHNSWVEAWWTMNHTTVLPDDNPEYEFFVNAPDSIAAYITDFEKWGYNENITFCVEVIDSNGCYATGKFNLQINPLVRLEDTTVVCQLPGRIDFNDQQQTPVPVNPVPGETYVVTPDLTGYDVDEELMEAILNNTVTYPYSVSRIDTIPAVDEGCDTILTTVITVLGYPTITGNLEDLYCQDTLTVGDLMDSVKITNYVEETLVVLLNGNEVPMDSVLQYSPDCYTLTVSCSSSLEMQCYTTEEFQFRVNTKPLVEDIDDIDTLCAGGELLLQPEYDCRYSDVVCGQEDDPENNPDYNDNPPFINPDFNPNDPQYNEEEEETELCTVEVVLKDSVNAVDYVVLPYEIFDGIYYRISPVKLAYNGKYIGFKVTNPCGTSFSNFQKLNVDTIPVGKITVDAICANHAVSASLDTLNKQDLLDPENITVDVYVKKVDETAYQLFDLTTPMDYSYNGALIYAEFSNRCGLSRTDTDTVSVSDRPYIQLCGDDIAACAENFYDEFVELFGYPRPNEDGTFTNVYHPLVYDVNNPVDLSEIPQCAPVVLPNGSPILHHYWRIATIDEEGNITLSDSVSVEDIYELAYDSTVNICYYAENLCGADTSDIYPVSIFDKPEISVSTSVVCPNAYVSSFINTVNVTWHPSDHVGTIKYVVVKADGTDELEIAAATTTFSTIQAYDGGQIYVIASSADNCGDDTAKVTFTIPVWTAPVIEFQPKCEDSEFSAFLVNESDINPTLANATGNGWFKVNADNSLTALAATDPITEPITVVYTWTTSCGDEKRSAEYTLVVRQKATAEIQDIAFCEGSNIVLPTPTITDPSSVITGAGSWTIDGVAYDQNATYGMEVNGKKIAVTFPSDCGDVVAEANITVYPNPVVELTGDSLICDGEEATFVATSESNIVTYVFAINGDEQDPQTSNEFTQTFFADEVTHTSVYTVSVAVTDDHNCQSTAAAEADLIVTGAPTFIFIDSTGTETHNFTATTGQGIRYTWMVSDSCFKPDYLVFVEYDIYYEGQLLSNAANVSNSIDSFFCKQTVTGQVASNISGYTGPWITSNYFEWYDAMTQAQFNNYLNGTSQPVKDSVTAYYRYATGTPYTLAGNHFPYTQLANDATATFYDDLWMHFLVKRPIRKTFVPFRRAGEYKVVYRLYYTDHRSDINLNYFDPNKHNAYTDQQLIGGHSSLAGGITQIHLLTTDSIFIDVTGDDIDCTTGAPVQGMVAPGLVVEESMVAPDMEVWPNPAPATVTTLKARVHNMSGEGTVTLTSLSGKQVYSGKTYIDNDNYYFEFNVNNLTVGSYILTVRTADAIVTKKVVVTVLAR